MAKTRGWAVVARGAIILTFVTLFLPVLTYRSAKGMVRSYNILGFLGESSFEQFVFSEYTGSFLRGMPYDTMRVYTSLLALVGVGAIVMAFVGIHGMSKQYESNCPFRLAVWGLVGTAIPSLTLLVLSLISADSFQGSITLGPYEIVTPVSMICACMAVTARHRLTAEEARLYREASVYIYPAGDLSDERVRR